MNTTQLSPDTEQAYMMAPDEPGAFDQAFEYATRNRKEVHCKAVAICDLLDAHIESMRAVKTNDDLNITGSDLDHVLCNTHELRKSSDLSDCYMLNEENFKIFDSLLLEAWKFGVRADELLDQLEGILYDLHELLDQYGEIRDIKPIE